MSENWRGGFFDSHCICSTVFRIPLLLFYNFVSEFRSNCVNCGCVGVAAESGSQSLSE